MLVSMKGYNKKVSLYYSSKEIKISSIYKDSKSTKDISNYLSINGDYINYLTKNIDNLKN